MEATSERLMKPKEVAAIFGIETKTVNRWARTGKLPEVKTVGGHRRFRASDVDALWKSVNGG